MKRRSWLLATLVLFTSCRPLAPPSGSKHVEPDAPAKAAPGADVIHLASGVWAPFTDEPSEPRYAIDLVHEALSRGGYKVDTKILHPQELMPALRQAQFDGSEALWLTKERQEYLLYSEAFLENRFVLLGPAGADVSAKSIAELKGKRLAIVDDYAYGPKILETPGPELIRGQSDRDNLRLLLKGEVDYVLVDELLVYFLFRYSPERAKEKLAVGAEQLASQSLYFAIRKDRHNAPAIIKSFNEQIHKMTNDGSFARLLKVTWMVADVDGDGLVETVLSGTAAGTDAPSTSYQLSGSTPSGGQRFMIEGEVYTGWQTVPDRYKQPSDLALDDFRPAINLVLFEF